MPLVCRHGHAAKCCPIELCSHHTPSIPTVAHAAVVSQRAREQREAAAKASVIAREAECRAGELLAGMNLKEQTQRTSAGPGRGKKTVDQKAPTVSPLAALGIKPAESKRMQAAASVPVEVRREVLDAAPVEDAFPFVDLTGSTIAGAVVLQRVASVHGAACWAVALQCGHEAQLKGSTLRKLEKDGQTVRCQTCTVAAVPITRAELDDLRRRIERLERQQHQES